MTDHNDADQFGAAPPMDAAAARAITDQIRQSLEDIWELVVNAYRGRVWIALNHPTWHEYCEKEFGHRLRLPREEREKIVRFLSEAGLTIRPIASAMGISPQTVQRDLAAGVSNHHTCGGTNGTSPMTTDPPPDPASPDPASPEPGDGDGSTNGKGIGQDGKPYSRKGKRRITPAMNESFASRFDVHMTEMRRGANSIERMCRKCDWAAPHAELRSMLKLLRRVEEIIERVLAMPEQTTIFDDDVPTDEEIDARVDSWLPLKGAEPVKSSGEVVKPWQHGYAGADLKGLEDRFAGYNRFARGPHGGMNKPAIAEALHHSRLHVTDWGVVEQSITSRSTPITAYLDVMLARKLAGDRVVNAFTYSNPEKMTRYLASFSEPTWVWIWQECDEQRQIVLDAGYDFIGGKITSFAEIRGLYFKDPAGRDKRHHPSLDPVEMIGLHRTPINVDVAAAVNEINALPTDFTPHYSNYAGSGGKRGERTWSALSLRGYTSDPGFIIKPQEMDKKWKLEHADEIFELQDTALRAQLPAVDALHEPLTSIAQPHRIRLMRLTPGGGKLRRHTDLVDKDSGIADGHVARFHIPIITNPDVTFTSWDMRGDRHNAHMKAGEIFYLDTRKAHQAVNAGADARVHLVVDVEANDAIRSLLT